MKKKRLFLIPLCLLLLAAAWFLLRSPHSPAVVHRR